MTRIHLLITVTLEVMSSMTATGTGLLLGQFLLCNHRLALDMRIHSSHYVHSHLQFVSFIGRRACGLIVIYRRAGWCNVPVIADLMTDCQREETRVCRRRARTAVSWSISAKYRAIVVVVVFCRRPSVNTQNSNLPNYTRTAMSPLKYCSQIRVESLSSNVWFLSMVWLQNAVCCGGELSN